MRTALLPVVALLAAGPAAAAPVPKQALPREGVVAYTVLGGGFRLVVVNPDGTAVAEIKLPAGLTSASMPRLSPDGRRVAYRSSVGDKLVLRVHDVAKPDPPLYEYESAATLSFAWADGRTVHLNEMDREQAGRAGERFRYAASAADVETGRKAPVPALEDYHVSAFAPDGTAAAYRLKGRGAGDPELTAHLVRPAAGKEAPLSAAAMRPLGFAADGRTVLALKRPTAADRWVLVAADPATQKDAEIKLGEEADHVIDARYSPDGTRLLVLREAGPAGRKGPRGRVLEVRKADGSDPRALYESKEGEAITGCDWR